MKLIKDINLGDKYVFSDGSSYRFGHRIGDEIEVTVWNRYGERSTSIRDVLRYTQSAISSFGGGVWEYPVENLIDFYYNSRK